MTSRGEWNKFWKNNSVKVLNINPFVFNLNYIIECLNKHYGAMEDNMEFHDLVSLEVGCGRGILSDLLDACFVETHKIDKYYTAWNNKGFQKADVFDMPFSKSRFDLAFSYGLLEHYDFDDQLAIMRKMLYVTKPGGINIHYVVPRKLTNIMESTSVRRNSCKGLRRSFENQWVFPVLPLFDWKTNKWLGKGFFIVLERGKEFSYYNGCFDNVR